MDGIIVEQLLQKPADEQEVEIVERKGLGHPDSICDAVANHASVALCREYERIFGQVLHHNLDKSTLVAGTATPAPGGGRLDKPMRMIFGDRATSAYKGKTIDVPEVVIGAARKWIRQNLRFVDPDQHVLFQSVIETGSQELTALFEHEAIGANDTSAAVGFAPLSGTESLVYAVERHLNSAEFKHDFPETGEDVKVMGVRRGRRLHLTVAVAFVDRLVNNRQRYFARKEEINAYLLNYVSRQETGFENVKIDLNALDDPRAGSGGMYLTVLGISADGADSGQVGRGNRASGLISIGRPQSIEAHAGKNPVNHIGKIYSYFSQYVAGQIYRRIHGIREVYVSLCGQIGRPIHQPLIASLKIVINPGFLLEDVEKPAASILIEELSHIDDFQRLLATADFYTHWEQALFQANRRD